MSVERIEEGRLRVEIARRVQRCRALAGFTQEQLAHRAEISLRFVTDLESGTVTANALVYIRIARALNRSVNFLLTGEEAPPTAEILELLQRLEKLMSEVLTKLAEKEARA